VAQPNNEKILALIQGAEEYMQNLSRQLIDAHATPSTLASIVQAWQTISYCYANNDLSPNRAIGATGIGGSLVGAMALRSGYSTTIGNDSEIEEFLEWKNSKTNESVGGNHAAEQEGDR
jgi:hypothetical protein